MRKLTIVLNMIQPFGRRWSAAAALARHRPRHGLCLCGNVIHNQITAIEACLRFSRYEYIVAFIVWPIGLRLNVGQSKFSQYVVCMHIGLRMHVAEQWIHITIGAHISRIKRQEVRLRFNVTQARIEIIHCEIMQTTFIVIVAQIVQVPVGFSCVFCR